ncbi:MAG: replication-associated recombination protein A [Liquorilactobacillus nagelii]|uniref:replication-associated recombination protein A n=1 Tax=Liquorilactobacillus nagelii TaxID=82688 RepID=UPI00070E2955|nr:replication-associated recombination protein A [Liquorilactobacillus nagelii]MCI1632920.1 replication-associated recombination protein A [Liquorilactobacillus nagelii]MCI1700386.1 replication-associated recombination protein A [Liquorilactobacillus nagelii]MCI1921178.1 replication-associated recombination protein A [Liquorilactobacillus nagelii]MCI1977188.1 replication-associated recombination protein A [Liquorilactobacillus nagelii]QYH54262.1 replication-associated recombination protein A 
MKPLAFRMRPRVIDEVIGQQHLVGPGKIIRRMVTAKMLSSMILYGPPGTGKTSIASAIAGSTKYALRTLNAATDSKKELEAVAAEAKMSGTVILMLDEIHRLTKPKQDFLLPHLESGRIILIGATTENPYIAINPAIRSRTQIFQVKPLSENDIKTAINRALTDSERGLGKMKIQLEPAAEQLLTQVTHGDLRSVLNALELAAKSTPPSGENQEIKLTLKIIEECIQHKALVQDKDGDAHYDVISAFQKSIRGSDTDAALHYLARLLAAGDLVSVFRRLLTIAYEDIGLANPTAASHTVAAITAAEKIGLPEARIPLAAAVIELCISPKSNAAITAIDAALKDINQGNYGDVPDHLKDAHYQGAQKLGHGIDYKYPHDFNHDWIAQQYLPTKLKNKRYFQPKGNSRFEVQLKERYQRLKKAQEQQLPPRQ